MATSRSHVSISTAQQLSAPPDLKQLCEEDGEWCASNAGDWFSSAVWRTLKLRKQVRVRETEREIWLFTDKKTTFIMYFYKYINIYLLFCTASFFVKLHYQFFPQKSSFIIWLVTVLPQKFKSSVKLSLRLKLEADHPLCCSGQWSKGWGSTPAPEPLPFLPPAYRPLPHELWPHPYCVPKNNKICSARLFCYAYCMQGFFISRFRSHS